MRGEAGLGAPTHIFLVIELLLLTLAWHCFILAHVPWLFRLSHLAVLLLIAGKLIWVNH